MPKGSHRSTIINQTNATFDCRAGLGKYRNQCLIVYDQELVEESSSGMKQIVILCTQFSIWQHELKLNYFCVVARTKEKGNCDFSQSTKGGYRAILYVSTQK